MYRTNVRKHSGTCGHDTSRRACVCVCVCVCVQDLDGAEQMYLRAITAGPREAAYLHNYAVVIYIYM